MGLSGYHLGKTPAGLKPGGLGLGGAGAGAQLYPPFAKPAWSVVRGYRRVSAVPVIVYDIPYRTGTASTRETLLALAAHPRIRAVKDAAATRPKPAR